MRLLKAWLVAGLLAGCATSVPVGGRLSVSPGMSRWMRSPAPPPRAIPDEVPAEPTFLAAPRGGRKEAVAMARGLVGKRKIAIGGRKYRNDCTGLVVGVYRELGLDLLSKAEAGDNGVTAIYRFAQQHGRVYHGGWPVAGDLVFFKETYDRNRDGRVNDGLTHVGLVDEVHPDGTVTVIHRVSRGVVRYRMNLLHRDKRADPESGRIWNDWLRGSKAGRSKALTGQLFTAFATVLAPETEHRPEIARR